MLKKILGILVVIIGAFLIYAATRPDSFSVQRSATIKAKPEKVFKQINDFHNWVAWSPWEKIDPQLKRTYSGAEKGIGAVYEWQGNSDAGSGRMEITESASPTKIFIKLDFIKPFESHNVTEFSFEEKNHETLITWTMTGKNNYLSKLMSIFMNMDKMVGKDFEAGLANLKALVEK